jgi:sugar O-acyltransferase (sialic acid O-acetyltransferase NeuD family)
MSERIGIFGAGGFGRELVQPLRLAHPEAELLIIDDTSEGECGGLPIVRLDDLSRGDRYLLAVGDGRIRERLDQRCLDAGLVPHTLIDPSARIGSNIRIGEGSILCGNTLATADAEIGRQFQCNWYSYVAHDCVIGNYVTFAAQVCCNGNVHIGDFAYVGTCALLRQGAPGKPLVIGEGAIVGMGAVVTKDVPPHTTVVGNPARPIKRH